MICGEGDYLQVCIKYVKDRGLKRVIFTGKVQPDLRAAYYKRADIFTIPSIPLNGVIEAWGLTVNESLEQGTPVISTNTVGASIDLITDQNGIIVSPGSVLELAEAIDKLLNIKLDEDTIKKAICKMMSKICQINFMKQYSVTRNKEPENCFTCQIL